MDIDRDEGPAFRPVPLSRARAREAGGRGASAPQGGVEPRCEMCGASVVATHCKRICLRCGFMTGCSEGI
jgi:hypothetical protein